ncbi:AAA family ATPase [Anaerovorax odorimutans]|uniref:AAA family ATPase n=1 Tax=Anaerovorax odorimutans TaxID=109327 RepID=UPI000414E4F0|nr:AAA family ATPase [Anaerovorax odorimutans]
MKIKVLVISKLEKNLESIKNMIEDEEIIILGDSCGGTQALDKIENMSPDMVIMFLGSGDTDVLSLTERIILHKPRTHVILLAEYIDVNILQSAIKAGAHNIIEIPTSQKEFAEYIKSVYHNENIRINSLNGNQNIAWMSRVVTIFGAKGGLGKTTIATNLAIKLAESHKKVALIDLDLQFGDIHIFLDIEPADTISELVQQVFTPNIDSVRSYMAVHSSGVHVLCAPKSPEYAELISAEKVQSLLSVLRTYYDYVIIDTPPSFSDVTLTAIESSSTILFVTGLDISILKNSKLSLSLLDSLQQKDKVRLIVNRAVDISSITVEDVQKIIGCPIWTKIPSDYKIAVTALNRGIPFVISSPGSKLSQSISTVANVLLSGSDNFDIQSTSNKKLKSIKENRGFKFFNKNKY